MQLLQRLHIMGIVRIQHIMEQHCIYASIRSTPRNFRFIKPAFNIFVFEFHKVSQGDSIKIFPGWMYRSSKGCCATPWGKTLCIIMPWIKLGRLTNDNMLISSNLLANEISFHSCDIVIIMHLVCWYEFFIFFIKYNIYINYIRLCKYHKLFTYHTIFIIMFTIATFIMFQFAGAALYYIWTKRVFARYVRKRFKTAKPSSKLIMIDFCFYFLLPVYLTI